MKPFVVLLDGYVNKTGVCAEFQFPKFIHDNCIRATIRETIKSFMSELY